MSEKSKRSHDDEVFLRLCAELEQEVEADLWEYETTQRALRHKEVNDAIKRRIRKDL